MTYLEHHAFLSLPPALADPHQAGEYEHQRRPQHGSSKAHYETQVRQNYPNRGERRQEQHRPQLALELRGFLATKYNGKRGWGTV